MLNAQKFDPLDLEIVERVYEVGCASTPQDRALDLL